MSCRGCGNDKAYHVTTCVQDGEFLDVCDRCRGADQGTGATHPDVYWPGRAHYNQNLCDRMGRPIYLRSRGHKAEVMKKLGLREAGDTNRGTRSNIH